METNTREKWLIIGAGASFGARCELPQHQQPVLGSGLLDYLRQWLGANGERFSRQAPAPGTTAALQQQGRRGATETETLELFLSDASQHFNTTATPFENAMNALLKTDYAWSTLPLVNRLLAEALLHGNGCRFAEHEDLYDEYLRQQTGSSIQFRSLRVISFNYDILFEEAALRGRSVAGLTEAVDYCGLQQASGLIADAEPRVRIYKPHGSINWFDAGTLPGGLWGSVRRRVSRISASGLGLDHGEAYVPLGTRDGLLGYLQVPTHQLCLAQYCHSKPVAANDSVVAKVRSACLDALSTTNPETSVTIVGLALPRDDSADDPFLSALFKVLRAHPGEKVYVDPSPAACHLATAYGLSARQQTFAEYLHFVHE